MSQICPVTHTMSLIGGKWKPVILYHLSQETGRFGALGRALNGVSKQMLTKTLRELENDGLIHRQVFAEVPPRVECTLTPRGVFILPIVRAMGDWGISDMQQGSDA